MTKTSGLLVGQQVLPDMGELQSTGLNSERLMAFSRAVLPENWGIDPADYSDINDRMLNAAQAENLWNSLINVPHGNKGYVVGHEHRTPYRATIVNIALTPAEYGIITRNSVESIGRAVTAKTLRARPADREIAKHSQAAGRSAEGALLGYREKMQTYWEGTLCADEDILLRFIEAAENPGLNRGKELDMRSALGWVKDHILGNMLVAMRYTRGWDETPQKEDLARRAIDFNLFLDRRHRIKNWLSIFALGYDYTIEKQHLFQDRIQKIDAYLENLNARSISQV